MSDQVATVDLRARFNELLARATHDYRSTRDAQWRCALSVRYEVRRADWPFGSYLPKSAFPAEDHDLILGIPVVWDCEAPDGYIALEAVVTVWKVEAR